MAKLDRFITTGVYAGVGRLAARVKPILLESTKGEAPARTGAFRASIVAKQRVEGPSVVITLEAASPLATYITGGTRPHVILPRNASVLRFEVAGGRIVFARRVNHPGTRPNPFPERALERSGPSIAGETRAWATGMAAEVRP